MRSSLFFCTLCVLALLLTQGCTKQVKVHPGKIKTRFYQITLTRLNFEEYAFSSLSGKVVLLDYFSSHCSGCLYSIPHIQKLYSRFGHKGLAVVGIALEQKGLPLQTFLDFFKTKQPITYPVLLANKDIFEGNTVLGQMIRVPQHQILDRCGRIRYTHQKVVSPALLQQQIEQLLKERARCAPPN